MYGHINSSGEIAGMVAEGRFDDVIRSVMAGCHGAAASAGGESVAELATALLHYLLTVSQIPSQRKVEYRGVQVDIVIPDLRTLGRDPQRALLVCITGSDAEEAAGRVAELGGIQPVAENIWEVHAGRAGTAHRSFPVSGDGEGLCGIVSGMAGFAGDSKLRMLGSSPAGPGQGTL